MRVDPNACLDENQLQSLLEGRMAANDPARAHLASCDSCSAILALARDASMSVLHSSVGGEPPPITRGQAVGRYLIVEQLGSGAAGVVYVAYDTELDRRIAVKVLRWTSDAEGKLRQRLRAEAQAMARLTHPNVIRVYDVGEHQGALFLTMELVDGKTLSEWLADAPRPWPDIAARFASAAAGLAAAHDAGVVHRDFKPANTLVRTDGHTFVTDFGLAHTLGAEGGRAIAGTPRYMAPEVLFGEGGSPLSDVFSFGVALYEALYGAEAFDSRSLGEIRDDLLDGSRQGDPVPTWLRAEIARSLDPDPEARQPTMHVLAEALRRVSDEDAARRCARAGLPAEDVWNDAIAAELSVTFMATGAPSAADAYAGVVRAFDAWKATWMAMARDLCVDTGLRAQPDQLLAQRAACLHRRRVEAAAAVEVLRSADAAVVVRALDVVDGLAAVRGCADLAVLSTLGPIPTEAQREVADAVHADLARSEALRLAARFAQGQALAEEAMERAERAGYAPSIAACQLELGRHAVRAGRLDVAHELLLDATCTALAAHEDRLAASALVSLGPVQGNFRVDFVGARRTLNLAAALITRLGTDLDLSSSLHHSQAQVAVKQGLIGEAIDLYRRALDERERSMGAGHGLVSEIIRSNLGNALVRSGDLDGGFREHHTVLQARIARQGPNHPSVANSYNNIGFALEQSCRYAEALEAFERGLATVRLIFPPGHLNIGVSLANTGFALSGLGHFEAALERLETGLEFIERSTGATSLDLVDGRAELVRVHLALGAVDRAAEALHGAFSVVDATIGREHPQTATAHEAHGRLLRARGDTGGAEAAFSTALTLSEQSRPQSILTVNALVGLGVCRVDSGRYREAIPVLERALAGGAYSDPRGDGDAACALACALEATEGADRVPSLLERARASYRRSGAAAAGREATTARFGPPKDQELPHAT